VHGLQAIKELSQYKDGPHIVEHRPFLSKGAVLGQVRHCPSSEQVAQSEGQEMQRLLLVLMYVPVGHVVTQLPSEVANKVGSAQVAHCVEVVKHVEHLVVSQAKFEGQSSLRKTRIGRCSPWQVPFRFGAATGKKNPFPHPCTHLSP
jgi:hypothetical protein